MRAKIKCDNCGNVFETGDGVINLICQNCGCYDLRVDHPIFASPALVGGIFGEAINVPLGNSFYGLHENGSIWNIMINNPSFVLEEPESKPIEIPPPGTIGKEKPIIKPYFAKLVKSKRKLRMPIGTD